MLGQERAGLALNSGGVSCACSCPGAAVTWGEVGDEQGRPRGPLTSHYGPSGISGGGSQAGGGVADHQDVEQGGWGAGERDVSCPGAHGTPFLPFSPSTFLSLGSQTRPSGVCLWPGLPGFP